MKRDKITLILLSLAVFSCSSITMLRTKELNRVRDELDSTNAVRFSYLNKKVDSISENVNDLSKSFSEFNKKATVMLRDDRMTINKNLSDLQKKFGFFQSQLEESKYQLKHINTSVNVLSEEPGVIKKGSNDSLDEDKIKSKELYELAYKDYMTRKYDLAISEFNELLKKYPKSMYAEMSLYYSALIYQNKGKLDSAEIRDKKLIKDYKKSSYAKSAYIKLSEIYIKKGDADSAKSYLNKIIELFPDSPEASLAKDRLSKFK